MINIMVRARSFLANIPFLAVVSFLVIAGLSMSFPISLQKHSRAVDFRLWIEKTRKTCEGLSRKDDLDRCFRNILREAVKIEGTAGAVTVLERLRSEGIIHATFDDHQHVHVIGRETAKLHGLNSEAFLMCPSTYNYGCHHGFFEYVLSKTKTHKEAAKLICEDIKKERSPKLYSYCYHGVGHGLMMAFAYDLKKSLDLCNELSNQTAVEGCWQGSFMENSNSAVTDEERVFGFSKNDPLAPCNKVDDRYVWQCYINHAGYLMKVTNLNIKKATEFCLSSPNNGAKPCIQSIGLMTTNPIWQKSIRMIDTINNPKKNAETAWSLCQEMPEQAREDCVIGAVGNIHNFDEKEIGRSSYFCGLVETNLQPPCFSEIGRSVAGLTTDAKETFSICEKLKNGSSKTFCLSGVQARYAPAKPQTQFSLSEEQKLITNDTFLKEQITKEGPAKVIERLSVIMPGQNLSCHDKAHETGRFAYEIFGGNAFKTCGSQCHSGCYHGATEAFFRDKGTVNLERNLSLICQGQLNRFFRHQCLHGVGHGLMAWANYELFDALSSCNQFSTFEDQSSCWTGVFMENIVGGLTLDKAGSNFSTDRHYTKYLNNDPLYPCSIVPETYKGSCYFLQTSRMVQLFAGDFGKISAACLGVPKAYRFRCFQSMGRDVGGSSKHNVNLAIAKCQNAPYGEYRNECLGGAVQDTFWDPSGKNEALLFCSLLKDQEAKACYKTVTQRATEVLSKSDYQVFCKNLPQDEKTACLDPKTRALTENLQQKQQNKDSSAILSSQAVNVPQTAIIISIDGYSPKNLTVKRGAIVIFKNAAEDLRWPASNIHPTHRIYPEFDPRKPISPGAQWSFVFQKAGTWRFHDHLFPEQGGIITVVD